MKDVRNLIAAIAVKFNGDWESIYNFISNKGNISEEECSSLLSKINSKYVTILDEDYPLCFKRNWKPPFVLFYEGNLNLLKENKRLAVVGSRDCSKYGKDATKKICDEVVKEGCVIISGLARGIDTVALNCAVDEGKAVAFLGNGIDYYYPPENIELQKKIAIKGLLMSEYPSRVEPNHDHFPFRNRLIALSSRGVLVTEAKKKSGTLITVAYASGGGIDVFCVPYPINEESACNNLIKNGAALVESGKEILYLMENYLDRKNSKNV